MFQKQQQWINSFLLWLVLYDVVLSQSKKVIHLCFVRVCGYVIPNLVEQEAFLYFFYSYSSHSASDGAGVYRTRVFTNVPFTAILHECHKFQQSKLKTCDQQNVKFESKVLQDFRRLIPNDYQKTANVFSCVKVIQLGTSGEKNEVIVLWKRKEYPIFIYHFPGQTVSRKKATALLIFYIKLNNKKLIQHRIYSISRSYL